MITEKCKKCKYCKQLKGGANTTIYKYCDYLCMEKKRRPCEGGDECTVFVPKGGGQ